MNRFWNLFLILACSVLISNCGSQPQTYATIDSSSQGSTTSDPETTDYDTTIETDDTYSETSPPDTGATDTVTKDTGSADTGTTDTSSVDTASADTGSTDTGFEDTASVDTGFVDTDSVDTGPMDTNSVDTGFVDTDSLDTDTSPLSACEVAALRAPDLVCCSTLSVDALCGHLPQSCCTADLNGAMSCEPGEAWDFAWCDMSCGRAENVQKCLDNSCDTPFIADMTVHSQWYKQGNWNDYSNTFTPKDNSCGDGSGGDDIWFAVYVPAGATAGFYEKSSTNATVRLVDACENKSCVRFAEAPEQLLLPASENEATFFNVILSKAAMLTSSDWTVEVLLE